ncbi:hypothetical protein [Caballeronia catudaia]|uniref:hypothetical protein n=1 Tax=Caballeronia catudaia TaxID=1777136 RepID=UPI00117F11C0|nr:hypothetical protein [Caballeronia catudaia]
MRIFIFVCCFVFWLNSASADAIKSCSDDYSIAIGLHSNVIRVSKEGKVFAVAKSDHDIVGGVFSLDDSYLVVYGLPAKVDRRSPQAEILSIYSTHPRLHLIMKRTYGGGIYDIGFGVNQRSIFVNSRFGFEIIDFQRKKVRSFDLMSEPQFTKEFCAKR